jgi:hypothetical protein
MRHISSQDSGEWHLSITGEILMAFTAFWNPAHDDFAAAMRQNRIHVKFPPETTIMRPLSKTKLLSYRQCPKRLWLEIHHPELREDSAATQAAFATGYRVGDVARHLYDPERKGALIDLQAEGFEAAFARSAALLRTNQPIFEAAFQSEGALSLADVMLPVKNGAKRAWCMVEVKSSTEVKDYHRDDAAIQSFIARAAGVPLTAIALAHVDGQWVYPGNGDYRGLLVENDLTQEAFARGKEVRSWIAGAQTVAAKRKEPRIGTGKQCEKPYACGFFAYCQGQEPQAAHPIGWLPGRLGKELADYVKTHGLTELRDAPDAFLNEKQRRVKKASLSGKTYFDRAGAAAALARHRLPAWFMDFETIQFAVPIWKGTRPYQQIPFQFSVHRLSRTGKLEQREFLDTSGQDPSRAFAKALLAACGERGPIFVYNASFETARIRELAERLPRSAQALLALNERVVDLLPVAREHYYHPNQQGSWSIKAVLPALCPDLDYGDLEGVQDGGMAQAAFLEAVALETSKARKAQIERQLLDYCRLDTYALVRLWSVFSGSAIEV